MTNQKTDKAKIVELTEESMDKVRGGFTFTDLVFNSRKDDPPTPGQQGFIPSAGTSRMD